MCRKFFMIIGLWLSVLSLSQNPSPTPATQQQQLELRRQNFGAGRQLLLDRGVPFDPDELLRDNWAKNLKSALDAMPEMHQVRHETAPLKGAYLADTLYLPEKVKLSGHTIIVANYVVFEGKNPAIRGTYDLNFFPANPVVVLETTLAQVLQKHSSVLSIKFRDKLPSFSTVQQTVPSRGHMITIDTSGPEPQARTHPPRKASASLQTASWRGSSGRSFLVLPPQDCSTGCNNTGDGGANGTSGAPGAPGINGTSPPNSPDGNCASPGTGSNNGAAGGEGSDGHAGGNGGAGGPGSTGGNAGVINATVADGDANQWNFIANGGMGGLGGDGGNGGLGGNGGNGSNGGNGVACGCQLGSGGQAGTAGEGGNGGNGGNAGSGGNGGNGAAITVSLPFNSPGANTSNRGGVGNVGGGGGASSSGGLGGFAGRPGTGAAACGQKAPDGAEFVNASGGSNGEPGLPGGAGQSGASGPAPSVTFRPPPGGSGGGDGDLPDPCVNSAQAAGPTGDFNSPSCSPIIIDAEAEDFHLTSAFTGVTFDISGTGHPIQIAWTDANFHNAFLALPGPDGLVHNGKELFGNFTPQPQSAHPNGFLALAQFDKPENGGNGDGIIDEHDEVFSRLRLWIDANHDGICQPEELHRLPELGVYSLAFTYVESRRTDQFGNQFRYKARVNPGARRDPRDQTNSGDPGRWTYDVFLVTK